jgi:hypothetical protein
LAAKKNGKVVAANRIAAPDGCRCARMKVEAMQSVTYRFSKSPPLLDVLSLLSFALFLYPFLMTVGTGLRWLEVPGTEWIKSHGAEGIALFWLYLAAAAASGGAFVLILVWKSPTRNFVLLDDVGLTTAFMGMRRDGRGAPSSRPRWSRPVCR